MSRKAITRTFIVYFAVAAVLGALLVLATPGMAGWRLAAVVGDFFGRVIAIFVLPGFLPLIFWAFTRFRAGAAAGVFGIWALLAVLFVGASSAESIYEGELQFGQIPTNIASFFSSDYAAFVRDVKASCMKKQNPQIGFTPQQMDTYCQCSAEAMLKQMTIGQFTEAMNSRSSVTPSWLRDIAVRVAPPCQRLAMERQ